MSDFGRLLTAMITPFDENGDIGTIWRNVTPAGHADEVIEAIKSL